MELHKSFQVVEEGIVPGGGTALLYSLKALKTLTPANNDQKVGIDIVRSALEAPIRQIAFNAGYDASIVVGKIRDAKSKNYGFDAQTGKYVDMVAKGIIDPTKVVRVAIARCFICSRTFNYNRSNDFVDAPEKDDAVPAGARYGGMGGMGGIQAWYKGKKGM